MESSLDHRIAQRLRYLRTSHAWSLDELAVRSGVSRATLSRLENGAVSPTAAVLGRLCGAFGLTLSRLMHMVEDRFEPLLHRNDQPIWTDVSVGFRRRSVSPPAPDLAGEVLQCRLEPGARIDYDRSPRQGLEHHLLLTEGRLTVTVDDRPHDLAPGDCLRYLLSGPSVFATPADSGASYLLFIV